MSESYSEPLKSKTVKFNEVGDYIIGTLIEVSKKTQPDQYGKYSGVFKIKAKEGKFLGSTKNPKTGKSELDKEHTVIGEGEEWTIYADGVFEQSLKSLKIGQKFKVAFTEIKPSKKGNDAKIKTIFPAKDAKTGKIVMDEAWLKEKAEQAKLNGEDINAYDQPNSEVY